MSLGQRLSAVGRPCDVSQQAARSSRCSDETVGGIKASVEQNRTEPSRHRAVSQAACDVTAALERSIAVSAAQAYRRENEALLTAVCRPGPAVGGELLDN